MVVPHAPVLVCAPTYTTGMGSGWGRAQSSRWSDISQLGDGDAWGQADVDVDVDGDGDVDVDVDGDGVAIKILMGLRLWIIFFYPL